MKHPLLIVPLVAASVLAGCQHSPAPRTPSPAPTYACTPEAGGSPYPCNELQHKQQKDLDALYTEAEAVNTKLRAEMDRLYRAGGTAELTPVIEQTTTGEAQTTLMEMWRALKASGLKAHGGEFRTAWVRRNPAASVGGSVVSLVTCTDASSVTFGEGTQATTSASARDTMYFSRVDGALKLSTNRSERVESCA